MNYFTADRTPEAQLSSDLFLHLQKIQTLNHSEKALCSHCKAPFVTDDYMNVK